MRRWLLAGVFCLAAAAANAVELNLEGGFEQGSLTYGRTEPGTRVFMDGVEVPVAPDGRFLLGFDRDAPESVLLVGEGADGSRVERRLGVEPRTYDVQRIDGLPPEQVSPPPELLERIAAERARITAGRLTLSPTTDWASGFAWPVEGRLTGVFGSQRILNGEPRQPHYGLDIAAPTGTPVKAPADGVVSFAESDLFYQGALLIIDHGQGLHSNLMHLSEIFVAVGDVVVQGQVVAAVGATGRVTGAHLDWRVNWFEAWVDPALLVPAME